MPDRQTSLLSLANELLLEIVEKLDQLKYISKILNLNKRTRDLLLTYLFDRGCARTRNARYRQTTLGLFLGGAICSDTSSIIDRIVNHRMTLGLMGETLLDGGMGIKKRINMPRYLRSALAVDSPYVAAYLLKSGVDLSESRYNRPKLMPLCQALSIGPTSTQDKIDASLRIACSYVLPRTFSSFLVKGANPNAYSPYGLNAMHELLLPRIPALANDFTY
ncbi:hypothetical protein F5B22DRAFT_656945 [Xylaria bambusicola]|uniref:uncharacterized protein n=1 Tax=Xylaria bambusicola TaxID=326684 RepID=UPI002007915E|nr:uncharacterized protein F5B22DRAFT_656945 [Xylaria bambusicola]KAI0513227.1 hypothetical protein F5B22DRAFT_656945 [Xylaria bambusicola]